MCNKTQGQKITVHGINIEEVDDYIYLNKRISLINDTAGEVKRS